MRFFDNVFGRQPSFSYTVSLHPRISITGGSQTVINGPWIMSVHICEQHALQILKNFTMINLKKKQTKQTLAGLWTRKRLCWKINATLTPTGQNYITPACHKQGFIGISPLLVWSRSFCKTSALNCSVLIQTLEKIIIFNQCLENHFQTNTTGEHTTDLPQRTWKLRHLKVEKQMIPSPTVVHVIVGLLTATGATQKQFL